MSEDLASSPGSAEYQLFSMVKLEEFASKTDKGGTGVEGVGGCGPCVPQEVFTHPHRLMLIRVLLVPPCYTLGFPPPQAVPPHVGVQSQTPGEGASPLHMESFLGKQPLLAFVINSPSMSVSLCLDLPRKHEGWSIMAGQYFNSRFISVDPIHIFSLITQ